MEEMSHKNYKTVPMLAVYDPLRTTDHRLEAAPKIDVTTCLSQSEIRDWEEVGAGVKLDAERSWHIQICPICREVVLCLDKLGVPPDVMADAYCREKTRQIPQQLEALIVRPEIPELPVVMKKRPRQPAKTGLWDSITKFFRRS
ncbi:MAG: hypothetical protein Q7S83_04200 [bacterium]|nr:hypothetical protein [bacterium]